MIWLENLYFSGKNMAGKSILSRIILLLKAISSTYTAYFVINIDENTNCSFYTHRLQHGF